MLYRKEDLINWLKKEDRYELNAMYNRFPWNLNGMVSEKDIIKVLNNSADLRRFQSEVVGYMPMPSKKDIRNEMEKRTLMDITSDPYFYAELVEDLLEYVYNHGEETELMKMAHENGEKTKQLVIKELSNSLISNEKEL